MLRRGTWPGTLLMIDDELGAANMPPTIPLTAVSTAKTQ